MSKESWYARKLSDMDVVRILDNDDWIVEYDRSRGMYRVSKFEDNHFVDECWFDAYEEKEVDDRVNKIIDRLEKLKINFKKGLSKKRVLDDKGMEYFLNRLITEIKELK